MSKKLPKVAAIGFLKGLKIWALVAHRAGADIFSKLGPNAPSQCLMHLMHPDGRLKDQELKSERQGRVKDRKGKSKHAMTKENAPHVQMAKAFAKDLAKIIEDSRKSKKFDRLVLVAPAEFLGYIQPLLSKQTSQLILATVRKDLMTMDEREIQDRLDDILNSLYPAQSSQAALG